MARVYQLLEVLVYVVMMHIILAILVSVDVGEVVSETKRVAVCIWRIDGQRQEPAVDLLIFGHVCWPGVEAFECVQFRWQNRLR